MIKNSDLVYTNSVPFLEQPCPCLPSRMTQRCPDARHPHILVCPALKQAFLSGDCEDHETKRFVRDTMANAKGLDTIGLREWHERWTFLVKTTDELLAEKKNTHAHALANELLDYFEECQEKVKLASVMNASDQLENLRQKWEDIASEAIFSAVSPKVPSKSLDASTRDLAGTLFDTIQTRLDEIGGSLEGMPDTTADIKHLEDVLTTWNSEEADMIQKDRCMEANSLGARMIVEFGHFSALSGTDVDECVSILEGKMGTPPMWEIGMPESEEAINNLMAKLFANLVPNPASLTEQEATIQVDFLIKFPVDLYSYAYQGRLYARSCNSMLGVLVRQMDTLPHKKKIEILRTVEVNEECWKVDIPTDQDDPWWVRNWQDVHKRVKESKLRRHRAIKRTYDAM